MPSPRSRAYLYAVGAAGCALLGFYGFISAAAMPLWLGLLAAACGFGMAKANVNR